MHLERDVANAWDQVVRESVIDRVSVLDNELFGHGITLGLNDGPLDLTDDQIRIDGAADVVGADHSIDLDVTGVDVDGRFHHLGDVSVRKGRVARPRLRVQRLGARRDVTEGAEGRRSPSFHCFKASSTAPRMELPDIQVSREAEADPGITGAARVGKVRLDLVEPNTGGFGRHLGQHRVGSLAAVGPPVKEDGRSISSSPCNSTVASHRSGKPKENPTFLNAQAKPRPRRSDPAAGNDANVASPGDGAVPRSIRQPRHTFDHLRKRHDVWQLRSRDRDRPIAEGVAHPDLDRVHAQCFRQFVDLALGHQAPPAAPQIP